MLSPTTPNHPTPSPPLHNLDRQPHHTTTRRPPPQQHLKRPYTQQTILVRPALPSRHHTTNMTTSVPSVEDITNAFPTPITKITDEPNYEG